MGDGGTVSASGLPRVVVPRSVPARVVAITAVASVVAAGFAVLQAWPLWAVVLAGLVAWLPVLTLEVAWTHRHHGWLSLFAVLVLTQGGHVVEHVVQIVQIHVLGVAPKLAHGVFGALDAEWVHVAWNTWVLLAVVLLVARFRQNAWLWMTLVFALWHEAEHLYLIVRYVQTSLPGDPGLLADGGAIGGGLPIRRAELHFLYNLVETTPILVGFLEQLRRTQDRRLPTPSPV